MTHESGRPARLRGILLALSSMQALAESSQGFLLVDSTPLGQTSVNAGFCPFPFQRDKELNDSNPALGVERQRSNVISLTAREALIS